MIHAINKVGARTVSSLGPRRSVLAHFENSVMVQLAAPVLWVGDLPPRTTFQFIQDTHLTRP